MPRPTHFEIPAEDVTRATDFYKNVFGWQFSEFMPGEYYLASTGPEADPGIDGAVMKRKDPRQPLTNSILVDSVDSYSKKVEAAGGVVVVPKTAIPKVGYIAYFKDTEGNIQGLYQEDSSAK